MKVKRRKSQSCPKFCDKKGCYDTYEKRKIMGKWYWVWVSHCKTLDRIERKILGKLK